MLNTNYSAQDIEKKWHEIWDHAKTFAWDKNETRENSFVIDTPPPTVSGLLHMGHIFSYTQADFIARYQRMKGKNVYYPIGFDDNGLPTERLVEKIKGVKASQVGREAFIKLCEEVVAESEEEFRKLFKSTAMSFDWTQEYQTISVHSRKLSQMSFLDLVKNGHIERNKAPVSWDPVDGTAIAQAEIEDKEKPGVMNYIKFGLSNGEDLTIATTRPELLAACVAVFYHPEDTRYNKQKDLMAIVPIYGHKVPFIADDSVDMEKGSGAVMCCTFGDIKDVEWWRKYKLPTVEAIALNGKMQNSGFIDGLYVKDARAKIIEKLQAAGLVIKQEPITQFVKCAERSGAPLELITTSQWYVKTLDIKEELLAKARECKWNPDYMLVRMENWINGLNQDWCISRQRYFGVPFPVWYSKRSGEEGKMLYAEVDQLPVNPMVDLPKGYDYHEVEPDFDVMDTWATSSITPQINSHSTSKDYAIDYERHQKLFPADLRPQAHEIIRTWGFYTLLKSFYHQGTIPWKNLMISGWCLAADKTKMSKSKGNVITPRELIEEKGADIVRYWASNSKLGVDIIYSEDMFKIGHKLCNKIWNASKFVAMHLTNISGTPTTASQDIQSGIIYETLDKWIIAKLHMTVVNTTKNFEVFEYCDARVAIEDFFWNDLCDNYLELVKVRIYNEEPKGRQSAIYTLHHVLSTILKLFAPLIPHVVEEVNSVIFPNSGILSRRGTWPAFADYVFDESVVNEGANALKVIELIRKFKSINNISLRAELDYIRYTGLKLDPSLEMDVRNAANSQKLEHVGSITVEKALQSTLDEKLHIEAVISPLKESANA